MYVVVSIYFGRMVYFNFILESVNEYRSMIEIRMGDSRWFSRYLGIISFHTKMYPTKRISIPEKKKKKGKKDRDCMSDRPLFS